MLFETFRKPVIAVFLTFCLGLISLLPTKVLAAPIPALLADGEMVRQADLEQVRKTINTRVVANRLQEFGLTPAEIEARLSSIPDAQLAMLAQKAEMINQGGHTDLYSIYTLLLLILLFVLTLQVIAAV